MLSEKVFKDGLKELENVFDRINLTEDKIKIWYKYSKDLSDGEWQDKIKKCIKYCNHTPTLADILNVERIYKIEREFKKPRKV